MRLPTFLFLLCSLPAGLACAASNLIIDNATVRQPLPGKTVSAGYFTVTNPTAQPLQIVAASSSWFGKTELHQHSMVDGMMRMEQIKQIEVAPGATVHLQPGGLHLMLFRPSQQLELGQQVPLQIQLASGEVLTVSAVVTRIPKQ